MHIKRPVPQCILAVLLSVFMVLALLPATAAAAVPATTSCIGVTSDVHGEVDTGLEPWLDNVDDTAALNHFIFGGDFEYAEMNCNVTAAACAAAVHDAFPAAQIYAARGNHDVSDAVDYDNVGIVPITQATEDTVGYNTGLVYDGLDYAVYIMDSSSQTFPDSNIGSSPADEGTLWNALETVSVSDSTKPFFVVSHCPIHYYSNTRNTGNTKPLLDVLNQYPNVIFLWGHNHSQRDPEYGVVRKAGYVIKYTSSKTMPINFTYANMGAIYDNSGGNNGAYGLLMTITKETASARVDFVYKDLDGEDTSCDFILISNEIDSVALTGLSAPVGGAVPDTDAVASSAAISPVAAEWTDNSGNKLASGDTFTAGNTYAVSMTLTPASGKAFTAATTVTVNGKAASAVLNGDGTLTATCTFTTGEPVEVYQLASSITSGRAYAIVFDGAAMNTSPATDTNTVQGTTYSYRGLGYLTPNISGDALTFDTPAQAAAATWIFTAEGDGWTIKNGGNYLYAQAERTLIQDPAPHVFTYGAAGDSGKQLSVTIDDVVFSLCFGNGSSLSDKTADLIYPSQHNTNVLKLYENSGTIAGGDPPVSGHGYALAAGIESGSTYLIVAEAGGNAYALTTGTGSEENTLSSAPVTVSGNKVSAAGVTDAMKWLFTADGDGYDVTNGSCYLNRKSGGGLLVKAEEDAAGYSDWIYDDDNRLYTYNHSTENYLYLSAEGNPGYYSTDNSTGNNVTIYLYKVTGTPVDRVAVTDIAPPAAGASPDTSARTDIGTAGSVSWHPAVNGTFAGNTAYTASVTLSVPEGYFFTSDTAATLNGQKATPVLNANGTLTVSYKFPKTGAAPVIIYEHTTPDKVFTDVKEGEWYYDAVQFVADKEVLVGTSDTTFEPGAPMTRAMLVTVLYRMEGSPAVSASNPFPDVPAGEWFTDATLWARRYGVAAGYPNGTFRPGTNLTREQLTVFLCNYARYKGYDMARGDNFDLRIFSDAATIADYAGEAMKWACGVGLMKGRTVSLLAPEAHASRAEVAAILKRFIEEYGD